MDLFIASVVVVRDLDDGEIEVGHCPVVIQAETALQADVVVTLRAGQLFPSGEGWGGPGINMYKLEARIVEGAWRLPDLSSLSELGEDHKSIPDPGGG